MEPLFNLSSSAPQESLDGKTLLITQRHVLHSRVFPFLQKEINEWEKECNYDDDDNDRIDGTWSAS